MGELYDDYEPSRCVSSFGAKRGVTLFSKVISIHASITQNSTGLSLLRVDGVVDTGVEFSGPIYFLSWARLSDLLVLKTD